MLGAVNLTADCFDFRAHHQQQGECIVPGCDGRSVGIIQVVAEDHLVGVVAHFVNLHRSDRFHNAGIEYVGTLVLVPVHQVVSVDQGADVDISSIVAEQLGKEVALGYCGMSDNQFFGCLKLGLFSLCQ